MNNFPKISVVVITYGHQDYILETIKGVLMQQYQGPIEFIIANDKSPDRTDEIITKYFNQTSIPENFEIKYTNHSINKGMMGNFIWALNQATGHYTAFCEGDDFWTDPLKLHKQVDFLESNLDFSLCFTNTEILNQINKNSSVYNVLYSHLENRSYSSNEILSKWTIPTGTIVFRNYKNLNLPVNADFVYGDIVLFLRLAQLGKIWCINDVTSKYRRHAGGETFKKKDYIKLIKHYNAIYDVFGDNFREEVIKLKLRIYSGSLLSNKSISHSIKISKEVVKEKLVFEFITSTLVLFKKIMVKKF